MPAWIQVTTRAAILTTSVIALGAATALADTVLPRDASIDSPSGICDTVAETLGRPIAPCPPTSANDRGPEREGAGPVRRQLVVPLDGAGAAARVTGSRPAAGWEHVPAALRLALHGVAWSAGRSMSPGTETIRSVLSELSAAGSPALRG